MSMTLLKIIAVIAMFVDHIGQFIPNSPEWFHFIGRIAVPIFIFGVVVGYEHTTNRKKYLLRLYVANLGMAFIVFLLNMIFKEDYYLTNNFFTTLFLIVFIINLLRKKQFKYIILFLMWQILTLFGLVFLVEILNFPNFQMEAATYFWGSIFGNILFTEGGPLFILLGVSLYFVHKRKINVFVLYSLFSFCIYYLTHRLTFLYFNPDNDILFPFADYQWMMIIAVPLLLLYNSKKGIGLKYFFYIFYPGHIVILFLLGIYLQP
ncbi:TraX family protein [Robertmurraya kyonggiensis]|uniref:TraX protein n=1 Tax=Robertmurraya kyonggiensis TaxID=1037680 RepID=A0A4U1CZF6_9BACI|nr:TraX family protein [Robertmurraya kyonggiensis]TKC15282.1 hypothetical protein FA727_17775 [Robertmurraya kyonggiensis]